MEIRKGTTRAAFVTEGSTIKVPRPVLIKHVSRDLLLGLRHDKKRFWKLLGKGEDWEGSPRSAVQGIFANQREGTYWKELSDIVLPTRSLLGGLLAIQPTTEDVPFMNFEQWELLCSLIGVEAMFRARVHHTLEAKNNYGWHKGQIRLRDFGGLGIPEFLREHQETFRSAFAKLTEELKKRVHYGQ